MSIATVGCYTVSMPDQNFPIRSLSPSDFPSQLDEIPEPPKQLYLRGQLPNPEHKILAVVGARNYSNYGKQVVEHLIAGLGGYPIAIVSGLALGIDGLAHEAALAASLYTLAIPGSGLDDSVLYPARHRLLARRILKAGGGLLSEYQSDFKATTWSFPKRNRIMAGLAQATLIIEANEKSGTLITARLTADYNRELLVVPGNIFSENSRGPHQFLKLGAIPITCSDDILAVFNLERGDTNSALTSDISLTEHEQRVLNSLVNPIERDILIRLSGLPTHEAVVTLMKLELNGLIQEQNGVFYRK